MIKNVQAIPNVKPKEEFLSFFGGGGLVGFSFFFSLSLPSFFLLSIFSLFVCLFVCLGLELKNLLASASCVLGLKGTLPPPI